MPFQKKQVQEVRMVLFDIPSFVQQKHLEPNWKCIIDDENQIFFTQLLSSLNMMREGIYYYQLIIQDRKILIQYDNNIVRITKHQIDPIYFGEKLERLVSEAFNALCGDGDTIKFEPWMGGDTVYWF